MIAEGIAETVVGTYATSHSHVLDARLLHSHAELLHQDIHDGKLDACSQVELVLLYEVRIRSHPLAQTVEETGLEAGETVVFDQVLAVNDGELKVGAPTVDSAKVTATVVEEGRARKVIVYKYKRKSGYHKKNGHRQAYTKVKIDSINA